VIRAARYTHDYKRHGAVDLYAALEIATGKVTHRVTESHTATDFLAFMKTVARRYPCRREQAQPPIFFSSFGSMKSAGASTKRSTRSPRSRAPTISSRSLSFTRP
jgi:hypothetical protein